MLIRGQRSSWIREEKQWTEKQPCRIIKKKASIKITEFRNGITAYVIERAEVLEELVRTAAERLGNRWKNRKGIGKLSVFLDFKD